MTIRRPAPRLPYRLFALTALSASLFWLAGCSSPPPLRSLPAASDAVAGSAAGPTRGAGAFTWSPQMDAAASELKSALAGSNVEVSRTNDNRLWLVLSGDNFEVGRGAVKPVSGPQLDKIAAALRSRPALEVRVVGHTDSRGDVAANDALSVDRAASVRDWLVMRGVAAQRFTVAGRGSREPLANNDTETGRAANRRVELLIGDLNR